VLTDEERIWIWRGFLVVVALYLWATRSKGNE